MTMRPAAMSATADSTESNGDGWEGDIRTKSPRGRHLSIRGPPEPDRGQALKSKT